MLKQRTILLSLALLSVFVGVGAQSALPGLLSDHAKKLAELNMISGTVSVQPLPGTQRTVTFQFSKPNLMKVESELGMLVCDGKMIYSYDKASNSYTAEPYSETLMNEKLSGEDTFSWAGFFNKNSLKDVVAKAGGSRSIKGTKVTEVNASWEKPTKGQATYYFDSNGVVKGCNLKGESSESLAIVQDFKSGSEVVDAAQFAFSAPAGSKKVESMQTAVSGYKGVQAILNSACMPCHNASNRKDGIDLSTYESITGSPDAVVAGDPEQSGIYRTTHGPHASMPKDRARLTEAQTKVIYDWIKDGAKKE